MKELKQCSTNFFVRGLLLTSKNNQGPSQLAPVNKECPDDRYLKFRIYISEMIFHSYQYIAAAHVTMQCMI
jgi:hypothetical protein